MAGVWVFVFVFTAFCALFAAYRLGLPGEAGRAGALPINARAEPASLLGGAEIMYFSLRESTNGRADRILARIDNLIAEFGDSLDLKGEACAEHVLTQLDATVDKKVEGIGFFQRFHFDAAEVVRRELLPTVETAYAEFCETEREALHGRLQEAAAVPVAELWDAVGFANVHPNAKSANEGHVGVVAAGAGVGALVGGGVGVALLGVAFPLGLLGAMAGSALLDAMSTYSSPDELRAELKKLLRPILRDVFTGDGLRDVETGRIVEAAPAHLRRYASKLGERYRRHVERARDEQLLTLRTNHQRLLVASRSGEFDYVRLADERFVVATLLGEVTP
jgi:hypothetical protein